MSERSTYDAPAGDTLSDEVIGVFPCAPNQARIWREHQRRPLASALNIAVRYRLVGSVSAEAIKAAVLIMCKRHEALRTSFCEVDGDVRQRIHADAVITVPEIDLSRLAEEGSEVRSAALAREIAQTPFDLSRVPLLRLQLVRESQNEAVLFITSHEIIMDGWSLGLFTEELGRLIASDSDQAGAQLAPVDIQPADFALWLAEMEAAGGFDKARRFWSETLPGVTPVRFERAMPGANEPVVPFIRSRLLPDAVGETFAQQAQTLGLSAFQFGLSSLLALLHQKSGERTVAANTQLTMRSDHLTHPSIGPFGNTALIAARVGDDDSFGEFAERVAAASRKATRFADTPFERAVPDGLDFDPLQLPVNFAFQNAFIHKSADTDPTYGGLTIRSMPSVPAGARWDTGFFMVKREEGWRISCEARPDLYRPDAIDALLVAWEAVIRDAALAPDMPLAKLGSGETAGYVSRQTREQAETASGGQRRQPPKSALERQLAGIWQDVLGSPIDNRDVRLFQLGADSLHVFRIVARSQEQGLSIDAARLMENPSVRTLAAALQPAETTDDEIAPNLEVGEVIHYDNDADRITVVQQGTGGPTVFAINSGPAYYKLAKLLGDEQTFIDVDVFGAVDDAGQPLATFEDNAAYAAKLVAMSGAPGPYYFIGFCVLGGLAYETACQLTDEGHDVRGVFLLNTRAPDYVRRMSIPDKILRKMLTLRETAGNFRLLWGQWRRGEITLELFLAHYGFMQRLGILELGRRLGLLGRHGDQAALGEALDRQGYLLEMADAYDPQPFNGVVVIYRSEDAGNGRLFTPSFGWDRYAKDGMRIVNVPGMHVRLTRDPSISAIATDMKVRLGGKDDA